MRGAQDPTTSLWCLRKKLRGDTEEERSDDEGAHDLADGVCEEALRES